MQQTEDLPTCRPTQQAGDLPTYLPDRHNRYAELAPLEEEAVLLAAEVQRLAPLRGAIEVIASPCASSASVLAHVLTSTWLRWCLVVFFVCECMCVWRACGWVGGYVLGE